MKRIFNSLIYLTTLFGCSSIDTDKQFYNFLKEVTQQDILAESKVIVVIPNAGCSGCIMASEQFMFESIDKYNNMYFILTAFNSIKELKAKYSVTDPTILRNKKVFLDTSGAFNKLDIDKRYPIILFVRESKIVSVEKLDVGNQVVLDKIKSSCSQPI